MHKLTWVLQLFMGVYFVAIGIMHFIVPDGLPAQMAWMYDLSPTLHMVAGAAEIVGGLGLLLPSLTRIKPSLTPLAAVGLIVVMLGAAMWHIPRAEIVNVVTNVVVAALLGVIAYVRYRTHPISARTAAVSGVE